MWWKKVVLIAVPALVVVGGGLIIAREKPVGDSGREADRRAIDTVSADMIRAFDRRDAAALTAHWTDGGEFVHNDGEPVRGRAAIQNGYAEFFKTLTGKPRLEVRLDALRFPAADVAFAEATLRLKSEQGDTVASGRQDTVFVREGGRWKVAAVREWDRDVAPDAGLNDLQWIIGTWRATAQDRAVTITYEWDESKAFIRGQYAARDGGKVVESGTQVIGKDAATGAIRGWDFQSDGGFAEGVWTRHGDRWSVDVRGVRANGKKLTATAIYIPVDANTVTWQAVNQLVDGAPEADTPPIKVTKQ